MPKRIDEFVSENRQSVKQLNSTFIPISGEGNTTYSFTNNEFEITTSIKGVYTRDLGNSLISGHPTGTNHGSGHGKSGDFRTDWNLIEDTESSRKFVVDGRNIVAKGLAGKDNALIGQVSVGNGTTTAQIGDSTLESENGTVFAFPKPGANNNESIADGAFLFHEYGDTISEFGVKSGNGNLYNRITTATIDPSNEKELRIEVEFAVVQGSTTGTSAITDAGKNKVAESLRAVDTPIGLAQTVYGTGTSSASSSDLSLDNRVLAKNNARELTSESVSANTTVFTNEPATQPHDISEIGVISTDGTLYWRTVIEPFSKDSTNEFTTNITFRIK